MKAKLETWTNSLKLKAIQSEFPGPSWILSEEQLLNNITEWSRFTENPAQILYPVKANPSLCVLQILAQAGLGVDCASKKEIDLALFAGVPFSRVVYNSPYQDIRTCQYVLRNGGTIVMDDFQVIMDLQQDLQMSEYKGKIWLRVLPDLLQSYRNIGANQEMLAHASESSRFGIPEEELSSLLHFITLPISGLHTHIGTQMDNVESFAEAILHLHECAEMLREYGHPVQDIDMGGGLGIPFTPSCNFPSISTYIERMSGLKRNDYKYYVEPGHALVGNAIAMLMNVKSVKMSRGKRWVITDVGTDQLAKISLLKWPHQILDPDSKPLEMEGNDTVAGPLCFAGDVLLANSRLHHINTGDPLLIKTVGAYTHALANGFNGRNDPAWLILGKDGKLKQKLTATSDYNNTDLNRYNWKKESDYFQPLEISLEKANALSSGFLREEITEETFEYVSFHQTGPNTFHVVVKLISPVDFISMPTAIRIIGDASIIGLLSMEGKELKKESVWGRRLMMDCYEKISSRQEFCFEMNFSALLQKQKGNSRVMNFNAEDGGFKGMFVLKRQETDTTLEVAENRRIQ